MATRIVRKLIELCRDAGYPNAELHASRFGRRVYGRLGFERTWEMRKWIDPQFAPKHGATERASKTGKKKGLDRAR